MCGALLSRSAPVVEDRKVTHARKHRVREFCCRFTARTVTECLPALALVVPGAADSHSVGECSGMDARCPLDCRYIIGDVPAAKDPEKRPESGVV